MADGHLADCVVDDVKAPTESRQFGACTIDHVIGTKRAGKIEMSRFDRGCHFRSAILGELHARRADRARRPIDQDVCARTNGKRGHRGAGVVCAFTENRLVEGDARRQRLDRA